MMTSLLRNSVTMRSGIAKLAVTVLITMSGNALAQKPVIYPAKGQSSQQQKKDDGQCYTWAKTNTGIDPAVIASTPPPQSKPGGERLKGAARGAVIGEAVGDNPGGGAAVGAAVGGAKARKKEAAQQQQAQAQKSQAMNTFYRAYGACMQGRGYTVK